MNVNFQIPSKKIRKKVKSLLANLKGENFIHTLEAIYAHDEVLLPSSIRSDVVNIGSGTSDYPAFDMYRKWIADDILLRSYYYSYSSSAGSQTIRKALSVMENIKLHKPRYTPEMICLTEGATGAISSLFEYFKSCYPDSEILIPSPEYYVFAFSAKYYHLNYREVIPDLSKTRINTIGTLLSSVSDRTKVIVITNPDNPVGIRYKLKDIRELIKLAKRKNIFLIIDEVFFDLAFDKKFFPESDCIAEEESALNNIILVKSYAKNKNLPGLRIGYILSTNREVIEQMKKIQEQRVFFATGSNYKTFIILDAFIQAIDHLAISRKPLNSQEIRELRKLFPRYEVLQDLSEETILDYYTKYCSYRNNMLSSYSSNFDKAIQLLKPYINQIPPKDSAFNTFVHIPSLDNVNYFYFCLILYVCAGIKVSMGPYFGLTQQRWQQDDLGFWMRVTFGLNRRSLEKGILRFTAFIDFYQKNKKKMIKTDLLI